MASIRFDREVVLFVGPRPKPAAAQVAALAAAFPRWRFTVVQELRPWRWQCLCSRTGLRQSAWQAIAWLRGLLLGRRARRDDLARLDSANLRYARCERLDHATTLDAVAEMSPWVGVALEGLSLEAPLHRLPAAGTLRLSVRPALTLAGESPAASGGDRPSRAMVADVHWLGCPAALRRQTQAPLSRGTLFLGAGMEAGSQRLGALGVRVLIDALAQADEACRRAGLFAAPAGAMTQRKAA